MVQLFKPGKGNARKARSGKRHSGKANTNAQIETVTIDGMDHQGKGVVRGEIVTFVDGAISGEVCKIQQTQQHKGVRQAQVIEVVESSSHRQTPFCPHFERCGGCQTQHIQHDWLMAEKQQSIGKSLHRALKTTGFTGDIPWQSTLQSAERGYRRKARLAVDARNSDDIKVGFRDDNNQVFNLTECQILESELQSLIAPLQHLVANLKSKKSLGHISLFNGHLFSGGEVRQSAVVSFRFTKDLPDPDVAMLKDFARLNAVFVQLQIKDDALQNLAVNVSVDDSKKSPGYLLNAGTHAQVNRSPFEITLNPHDFVQINGSVNQKMISRTLEWLELKEDDRVLDLFCGVGNFSLALATNCQQVVGFEGVPEMVQNATANAQRNGIDNVSFLSGDLTDENFLTVLQQQNCNKVVLDPARAGALKVMESLRFLAPEAIVYVSCNPATFGRDIAKLLEKNTESNYKNHYQLVKLSLVDMFPNTSHSEIMGLFRLHN